MSTEDAADRIVASWRVELPNVAGLPLELSKRLAWLAAHVEAVTSAELNRLGLTKAEFEVLATLRATGKPYRHKPGELAHTLLLSSGGTTNVLHRLTSAGLVVREADPNDRRSTGVRLTAEGVRVAEEAVLATNAAQVALFERVPEQFGRTVADQLRQLLLLLDQAFPARRR